MRNVVVWGNHSNTMYADVSTASVNNFPSTGLSTPMAAAINDEKWLNTTFRTGVATRGGAIIKARGTPVSLVVLTRHV